MNYTDIKKGLNNWGNYIAIILLTCSALFVSLFNIDKTGIVLTSYKGYGWILFVIKVILPPTIALLILGAFRAEGIKCGMENQEVSAAKKEWEKYALLSVKIRPRSLNEYRTRAAIIDGINKYTIFLLMSFLSLSILLTADLAGFVSLIFSFTMYIACGFKAKNDAENYVVNELVLWYKLDMERLRGEHDKNARMDK